MLKKLVTTLDAVLISNDDIGQKYSNMRNNIFNVEELYKLQPMANKK